MPDNETMTVTVKLFGGLRELVTTSPISLSLPVDAAVADLLAEVERRFPVLCEKLKPALEKGYINILLNGRNIRTLNGPCTPLTDGDSVAFLPPVGGG